jgi:hypothetical protein
MAKGKQTLAKKVYQYIIELIKNSMKFVVEDFSTSHINLQHPKELREGECLNNQNNII